MSAARPPVGARRLRLRRGEAQAAPRTTAGEASLSADRFVNGYLGYLLGQATHALYKNFDQEVRAAGLSSIEWRVLATLQDGPPLTVSQLAQDVLAKQPTVTKLVQRMADQGWVTLLADSADQRLTLVTASAAGKRLVRPLLEQARAHESRMLRTLAAPEQQALKKLLAKLAGL